MKFIFILFGLGVVSYVLLVSIAVGVLIFGLIVAKNKLLWMTVGMVLFCVLILLFIK